MNKSKAVVSGLVSILIFSFAITANGQTMEPQKVDSVTNEELKKVATIRLQARSIQRNANQKLREVVNETEISFQRYRTIMIARQNPNTDTLNVTQEEKEILEKIKPQLAEINQQSKQKFKELIEEQGLTKQRLQQIMLVLRTDKEAAQRFQKILAEQRNQQ